MFLRKIFSCSASVFLVYFANAQTVAPPRPYGILPDQNQLNWQENNMYAFIHFGLNTFTDKEWGYGDEDPELFNPKKFNADQIVRSVKQGGFTGIILTCKHHDGFCLWPTKTTSHNISQSPFRKGKGDLVREIEQACRKYGMRFGVYLSPWDRNAASYGTQDYINKIYREQMRELLTNYGTIFEIWHDGANGGDGYYGGARERRNIDRATYYNWPAIWQLEAKLQPTALRFGDVGPDLRWVGNEKGFCGDPCWQTFTPEPLEPGQIPTNGQMKSELSTNGTRNGKYWMPAEVDFSIRPGWFWHASQNNQVRSPQDLVEHYFLSIGRGGSMLLNVPPDTNGLVYPADSASLKKFGQILRQTFAINLAKDARIIASNIRGNDNKDYGVQHLLDNDQFTYWATDNTVHTPHLIITLPQEKNFDIIRLKENTKLGQRIDSVSIEALINDNWQYIGGASSIGSNRLIKLSQPVTTNKIRISIVKSPVCVALSDFGLFKLPELYYTAAPDNKTKNISKKSFTIANVTDAGKVSDNNISTFWQSNTSVFPQALILDLRKAEEISSFNYLPQQDGKTSGMIDKYAIYTSNDSTNWEVMAKGEFSNIQANPVLQTISFPGGIKARYIKFEILHTVGDGNPAIAELSIE